MPSGWPMWVTPLVTRTSLNVLFRLAIGGQKTKGSDLRGASPVNLRLTMPSRRCDLLHILLKKGVLQQKVVVINWDHS